MLKHVSSLRYPRIHPSDTETEISLQSFSRLEANQPSARGLDVSQILHYSLWTTTWLRSAVLKIIITVDSNLLMLNQWVYWWSLIMFHHHLTVWIDKLKRTQTMSRVCCINNQPKCFSKTSLLSVWWEVSAASLKMTWTVVYFCSYSVNSRWLFLSKQLYSIILPVVCSNDRAKYTNQDRPCGGQCCFL